MEIEFSFFSSGYLDVSVHRVPSVSLCIHDTVHEVFSCGFPHSDICGSMDICSSPQLFAAYHVFHRLLVPRHPPCALISLTYHTHSVECAVSCLCPSCDGFTSLLILFIDGSYSVFLGCLFFCLFKSFLAKVLFLTVSKIFVSSVFGFQGTILALLFHQPSKSTRPLWTFITVKLLLSGDGETRTLDPLLARQVLSQLSYTPA